jgi:hypothetical protein
MIGDYYGDGNRYRGEVSKPSETRGMIIVGDTVLHDTNESKQENQSCQRQSISRTATSTAESK